MYETSTVSGKVNQWKLNGTNRRYADVHLPYRDAIQCLQPHVYSALNNKGEQRDITESHSRKLKKEMWDGTYTPTQVTASLRKSHHEGLKIEGDSFTLPISHGDPLPQTDGSHRFAGLSLIVKDLEKKISVTKDEQEREQYQAQLDEVMNLEVGVRIHFDGDSKKDFVNLQAGRPVDASHMLSIRVQNGMADPIYKLALQIGKVLSKNEKSPFSRLIRFDSKVNANAALKRIPITTLMGKSSSDLATSLVGLAKINPDLEAGTLAEFVIVANTALSENAGFIFEEGKALTSLLNGGSKGSATMMVALGVCLAYRVLSRGETVASEADLKRLIVAAKKTLDVEINGNFSGPVKRKLVGEFARVFFADFEAKELHDGVPANLLRCLSCSTFNADADTLPKANKLNKGKKLQDVQNAEESKDEEVTEESLACVVEETTPAGEPVEIMG